MIKNLMKHSTMMIMTLLILVSCIVAPTTPGGGGESPLEPTPTPVQEMKIGYLENRGQLIIGDGMGAMPGVAIELMNQIFPDVPKESFKEETERLYEAVAKGDVAIAVGLPRPRPDIAAAATDPYFCAATLLVNENFLSVVDLNDKLRSLRQSGEIDKLISSYFKPQRQDTAWVTELGFEPLPFNEQGLGQFCTQAVYSRNILQEQLKPSEPLALDILRPVADQTGVFISKIESAPEPTHPDQFIVTIPVIPTEEVKAGGSGPIGILLRSAQPYDVSPTPVKEGTIGGRLLKPIATPPLAEQFLIEWDEANKVFKVTSAEGEVRLIEPIVLKEDLPSTDEVNIILAQGSVVICAQWDGYQGCLTVW